MAGARSSKKEAKRPEPPPPGATRAASDHDLRPGETPDRAPMDPDAAGSPGGGTEVGGLGGTNIGDGAPENADLEEALGTDLHPDDEQGQPPYSGHAGGAVGGTPAEGRASGGHMNHGLDPGGTHRGDTTIGAKPTSGKKK